MDGSDSSFLQFGNTHDIVFIMRNNKQKTETKQVQHKNKIILKTKAKIYVAQVWFEPTTPATLSSACARFTNWPIGRCF